MNMKKKQLLSGAIMVIGILVAGLGIYFQGTGNEVLFAGLIIVLAGLIVQDRMFRCPHCGKHIRAGDYIPGNTCPHCSGKLGDEKK